MNALSLVMLLSGAATLVLEIAWIRQLGLTLGRTHSALVTVTAAFLAGLAGGAAMSSRWKDARGALVRSHLIAGGVALVFPWVLRALDAGLDAFSTVVPSGGRLWSFVACGASAALILVPATLLGTALPLALRAAGKKHGERAGWLAALSAAGAAAGALGASFVLLPALGTVAAGRAGGVLALIAGGLAGLAPAADRREAKVEVEDSGVARSLLALLAATGALGMVLELSWVRFFTLVIGSTTFALGLILAGYVGGSALGALAADRVLQRRKSAWDAAPGVAAVAAGAAVLALIVPLGQLPVWAVGIHAAAFTFGQQQAVLFGMAALSMLLPAMALGAVFPFATAAARSPRRTGSLVAAGTGGSVLGTLAWGGWLMPAIGLQHTLALAGLALIGSGSAFCSGRLAGLTVAAMALFATRLLVPVWHPAIVTAGTYHYAPIYQKRAQELGGDVESAIKSFGKILTVADGPDALVAVRQQSDGTRSLLLDGKADASTMGDMRTQRLLGHLPGLLHPSGNALVIGLGSGVTAGSLLSYRFDHVDVVELVKEVAQLQPYFSADSRAPLTDPRAFLHVADAREFVRHAHTQWDVITSEPTNPWVAGAAALFTREFFEQCKAQLAPNGVICQWVPAYHQSPEDFRAILAGFRTVFPQATLWESTKGLDYVLVAGHDPLAISMKQISECMRDRQVSMDLAEVEIRDATDLLSRFVCGPEGLEALTAGLEPITDDRLQIEFSGPRARQEGRGGPEIANRVSRQQSDVTAFLTDPPGGLAADIKDRWFKEEALAKLRDGQNETALGLLVKASQRSLARGHRPSFLKGFFLASVRDRISRGDLDGANGELAKLDQLLPGDADLVNERGQLLVQRGAFSEAKKLYEQLTHDAPGNPHAWRNLAFTSLMVGDRAGTLRAARRASTLVPFEPEIAELLARTLYQDGNLRESFDTYTKALALDPASVESRVGLAVVASALGEDAPVYQ